MSGEGRVVVVTGGTRGIGLGLARELLARGCRVVICGRTPEAVAKALAELGAGDRATGLEADVSDREAVRLLWGHATATFGQVDFWINNAGLSTGRGSLHAIDPDEVEAVLAVNVLGVVNGCAVASEGMAAQPEGGWIWNMEGFGSRGEHQDGMAVYGASKRAVQYLTEALVRQAKGTPVNVGFLSPGIVATDLLVGDYADDPAGFEKVKKIFNILGDRVETVTPWLADQVLAATKHGVRVAWLTRGKAASRFATARFTKRDIFSEAP
ncbi:SDR family NAD(P)-dependent oxidoreductase [Nocardioides campestrisoli]|uniref:SDR family NAD(P)-dependent oxidoreductase n=1 Tax=Nocardioides campestrisoli TaxID=2736757 RepID=UPI00163DE19D|nr:SDR family NAD(P)-dependent oxidoreductase [Nocardioides campestrisoli]